MAARFMINCTRILNRTVHNAIMFVVQCTACTTKRASYCCALIFTFIQVCKYTQNIQAEVSTCLLLPGMLSNSDPFEAVSRLAQTLQYLEFKLM